MRCGDEADAELFYRRAGLDSLRIPSRPCLLLRLPLNVLISHS